MTRALRAGASGFLLKDTGPAELNHAVQLAAKGEPVWHPRSPANCWNGTYGPAGTPRPPCAGLRN
ncbi:hypothetical protein [Streptomyces sp. NPDC057199]|uniref:hypothetical protein n=1 Tax=Streptomyces sp. NPDC057199 TaxID=3346047 RepID=UPI00362C54C1